MTKTVIVTGGCGYIGGHIAKALKKNTSYRVVTIDHVRRMHTLDYCDQFIKADYASDRVTQALKDINPIAIVHCAGSLLVGESVVNPALYYDNNVAKTIKFLNTVKSLPRPPIVVFSSSAAVYGNPSLRWIPITEECPKQPINPYGHTKAMTEQILKDYDTAYGLKSMCLRYFNACGADPFNFNHGQAPGATHIIARALEAKLANATFTLNGTDFNTPDGTCVRDYVHVWDLALAHLQAIEYLLANKTSMQLNLGTNSGISNLEIVNYIKNNIGELEVTYGNRRAGDPDTLIADASKAHSILDWTPQYSSIDTIINSAWKWYNARV